MIHEVTGINSKNIVLSKEDLYKRLHCIWCHLDEVLEQAKLIHGGEKIAAVACEGRKWLEKGMGEHSRGLDLYLDKDLSYPSCVDLHKLKFYTCDLCTLLYVNFISKA